MTKNMKRIHKVTVRRISEYPFSHSDACVENNDHQAHEVCICTIGIRADAEIFLSADNPFAGSYKGQGKGTYSIVQTITSGGLWGIESDSDTDYLKQIEDEQLEELRGQLHAIGFSQRAINAAFRNVERG